ncbi:hypothetical protein ACEPAF_3979 [Sanghuangporus sanghuang]
MIRKTVKNSLSDVLSAAFRRVRALSASVVNERSEDKQKEKIDSDDVTLSGTYTSECSTLVDFVVPEPEAIVLSEDRTESLSSLLDDEKQAWSSTTSTINISSYTSNVYLTKSSDSNLSLLDEDECTWVMPRRRSNGRKKWTLFSSKVRTTKPQNVSLQYEQCQFLDPEERSWV